MLDVNSSSFGLDVEHRLLDMRMPKKKLAAMLNITPVYLWDILRGHRMAMEQRAKIVEIIDNLEKAL